MALRIASVVALLCVAGAASAQEDAGERAKRHNQAAKKLFSLGQFEKAAAEYEKAYEAKPHAVYLFNLAQCHKRIGGRTHLEKAIFYYRSYLANEPASPMREDIEAEIVKLGKQLASAPPLAVGKPPPPRPPRSTPPPIYKRWWFWTIVGAVVAGAATGVAVGARPRDTAPVPGGLGTYQTDP
jgi:tetratricopeptide (TPR) repeat protein